jgi:hypothetical protein
MRPGSGEMAKRVLILLGTNKGAFIFQSNMEERSSWELRGPFCECWPVNHFIADAATGTIYGGGGNAWIVYICTSPKGAIGGRSGPLPPNFESPAIDRFRVIAIGP